MSASAILAALARGHAAKQAAHDAKEAARLGTLSGGGSAGAVLADGKWYGKCGRLAVLRMRGYQEPKTQDTLDMFEHGFANEATVGALLGLAGVEFTGDHEVLGRLADGRPMSSHLDMGLTAAGKVVEVVECKSINSIWTARSVHYELKPKSDNLIQLGSYMMDTGAPGVLLYSSRVYWHLSTCPPWLKAQFAGGDVHDVQYDANTGDPFRILPFNRAYDCWFNDAGFLCYQTAGGEMTSTKLNAVAIRKYRDAVSKAERESVLLPRPAHKSVDGSKGYNPCDYCALKSAACDPHEGAGFNTWLDHVALVFPKIAAPGADDEGAA
jgi:hypothetical protein